MKYIDIHSHLNLPEYDNDREEVIERLRETQTATIVVGTDFETSKIALQLAETHDDIYACIGVHPVDDIAKVFELEKFETLVGHPKVVAIGECGLDYFHADKNNLEEIERQQTLFIAQIHFAMKYDKPIMIHSRGAYEELLALLEPLVAEYGDRLRGNVHFFAGNLEVAKRFWKIGFTTSFTGVITFARDYDEVIKNAPINMIMSETDAPFVAPVPYRGKRNEPSYVQEVVKKIAEIRNEDEGEVREALIQNVEKMFKI
jgi:TatD DNase family protein